MGIRSDCVKIVDGITRLAEDANLDLDGLKYGSIKLRIQ